MARPVFALRVRAEPGVTEKEAIRNLRTWLKRGLRDFGLRCLDVHQVPERAESEDAMTIDLNDADDTFELLPAGIYRLKTETKGGSAGRTDGLRQAAKTPRLLMLELVYTVIGGQFAGRKIWDYVSVALDESKDDALPPIAPDKIDKYRTAVRIGRSKLKSILDSAYGLQPNDHSEAADKKRRFDSYEVFDGLIFWAQVETRQGQDGYKPKNYVDFVITPDLPDYPQQPAQMIVPRKSAAEEMSDEIPF